MKDKNPAAGGSDEERQKPKISRGVIAGIAILLIAAVVFAVILLGNTGTNISSQNCDTQTGTCALTTWTTATPVVPVKSARPLVELWIMSFCPYGVQMETVFRPVAELLGTSTDIRVRYIATVSGTDLSTAKSLHGNAEAIEDVRQLCIASHAPEKYWSYIAAFDAQCYPVWTNQTLLSSCQAKVISDLGIPADSISQCITGSEGFRLLKSESDQASSTGTTGSPTLYINGQKYTGSRNPEAIKQGICGHFDVAPASCNTNLTTQTAAASGSC